MRIDAHTHFCPLRFLEHAERHEGKPYVMGPMYRGKPALVDIKARLDLLDRNAIDLNVIVPQPWLEAFPVLMADRTLAIAAARLMNDELAEVMAKAPKRFAGVAMLPTVDADAMVAELRRAVKELGFVGGYLSVGPTVKPLDHPDFEPLYQALVELNVGLWLHPSRPPLPDYPGESASLYQEWQIIGWPYDTTSAMFRIVFSGVFERYPGIRILTHHHGGFMPYYAPRAVGAWGTFAEAGIEHPTRIAKPYLDHFRKFYCDTAVFDYAPKVLDLAADFFGPERVLFATDAPFGPGDGQGFIAGTLASIDEMQISAPQRAAILAGNAKAFLGIG